MKRVIIPAAAIAAFALSTSGLAVNNTVSSTAVLSVQVQKLSAQTKKLEHEVWLLKKDHAKKDSVHKTAIKTEHSNMPWNHFVTVTTTPFMDKPMAYDGSDLLYNVTTINEDMLLLQQKQALVNAMEKQGYSLDRPILQVSGEVEGEMFSNGGFGTKATDGLSLSTGELMFNAIASSWASAFMSLDYNGAPISTGNRAPNSTIYLSRGFVTLGNLDVTPVYFSLGKMYVPFGRYANSMVSTPVTQSMAKILTPTALLGVTLNDGFYGSVYGFSGAQTSGGSDLFKQGGANAGYMNKFSRGSYNVGAGWVSNIADAQGQQGNGLAAGTKFSGFAASATTNNLVHRVDALDTHARVTVGPVSLIGEYIDSMRRYAASDMSYNGIGAQPASMHAEIDYMLPFFAKKYNTSVGVAYGHTWQALALNLPQDKYSVFLNANIWRETTESIEYNHQTDYATSAVASGAGATTNIVGTGKDSDSVLAEVGVFF